MPSHPDRVLIREIEAPASTRYCDLVAKAVTPLKKVATGRNDQLLTETITSLESEVLTQEGLDMVKRNYSGETSFTEWLDLVIRRRLATARTSLGRDYVQLLAEGDPQTIEDFLPRGRNWLERKLLGMVSGGKERQVARDVIDETLSDLFAKNKLQNFLDNQKAKGRSESFRAWVCKVGANRLIDELRRKRFRVESEFPRDDEGGSTEDTLFTSPETDETEDVTLATLREGLSGAFARLTPRQLFLVRLVFLHGIQRQTLASLLRRHPANIGKEIKAALDTITMNLQGFLQSVDPDGTLDLFDYIFRSEQFQLALHGDE